MRISKNKPGKIHEKVARILNRMIISVNEERFWRECILLHGLHLRLSQKDSAHMSNKHTMMFSGIDAKCVSLTMYIDG